MIFKLYPPGPEVQERARISGVRSHCLQRGTSAKSWAWEKTWATQRTFESALAVTWKQNSFLCQSQHSLPVKLRAGSESLRSSVITRQHSGHRVTCPVQTKYAVTREALTRSSFSVGVLLRPARNKAVEKLPGSLPIVRARKEAASTRCPSCPLAFPGKLFGSLPSAQQVREPPSLGLSPDPAQARAVWGSRLLGFLLSFYCFINFPFLAFPFLALPCLSFFLFF